MNSNIFSVLAEGLDEDHQSLAVNEPTAAPKARRRTICGRCGENHRTSTHDKCIREGRPLPNRPRIQTEAPAQIGRPVVVPNQELIRAHRTAAINEEFDENGDDERDEQLPDLQIDDYDSDDSNNGINLLSPGETGSRGRSNLESCSICDSSNH